MRGVVPIAVLLGVSTLLLTADAAFARAPTLEELPTVKEVNEEAKRILAKDLADELEAQKDPKMDTIRDYAEHRVGYLYFQKVAGILTDDHEDMEYRRAAADAFVERFADLDPWDEHVRKAKVRIGQAIVDELNDRSLEIRTRVAKIFEAFFPGQYPIFGYDPEETTFAKRNKAVKRWKEHLKGK
jgi:bacterioferritin (cytochrome b1)